MRERRTLDPCTPSVIPRGRRALIASIAAVVVAAGCGGSKQANVMRIDGAASGDEAGLTVAGAGDVNADGRADVLVSADYSEREYSGSVYVVFGTASTASVDLAALGARGFRIDGVAAYEAAGFGPALAGAGDVNGDGRADVLVEADNSEREGSGSVYVVFGTGDTASVDLAALGNGGFRIEGAAADDQAGYSVAGAGDVNGDGRADVLVGANTASNNGRRESGSAYVVYGKTDTSGVDLAALGARGFGIHGAEGEGAGGSVAGTGDVNGDGRPDVLVDGYSATNNGLAESGSAYVVFGTTDTTSVDLAALGAGGFRIDGAAPHDQAGYSVAGAGDVNADGKADVLVGTQGSDGTPPGSVYVVFGKADTASVDLRALGARGFRIDGPLVDGVAGAVAGAGDVNGDGTADVLVSAPYASNNKRENSGSAYIVFGGSEAASIDLAAEPTR